MKMKIVPGIIESTKNRPCNILEMGLRLRCHTNISLRRGENMKLLLAIGLAALAYTYAAHINIPMNFNGGPMDGTVWEVRVKPDSWFSFSRKDTLVFDTGRMTVVRLMATGFPSGAYSAAGHKGEYSWQASFQRENNESMQWTGHVQDNNIEGEITQHDLAGRVKQLHFKGIRRLS
jgi:hypothetical protein